MFILFGLSACSPVPCTDHPQGTSVSLLGSENDILRPSEDPNGPWQYASSRVHSTLAELPVMSANSWLPRIIVKGKKWTQR